MNDEKKEIELEFPPFEYERKNDSDNKNNQTVKDKEFFKLLAWPADKIVEFIDKNNKK